MKTNVSLMLLALLLFVSQSSGNQPKSQEKAHSDSIYNLKPRVIAVPDFGADPDEKQSMVRFLVSSNEFDIEGLINVTSCWRTTQTSASAFDEFIDA